MVLEIDVEIKWIDLKNILDENRHVVGLRNRFKYLFGFSHYAPLANFGIEVINRYQIPFDELKKL